ncbi:Ig-like domain-containing protein [Bradyrhizobium sp. URHD0069]|uniref:Ig-like domain-containing protein n=1 Tax=Bradyrhizobium sp. URHD0069 TaxID=1380355 RepID=UPI001FD8D78B|nr:Ig-like domain-containing protein [Bradyrhizobium sp. URHD0069]
MYKPAGNSAPPSDFTSVTGWGQVYQKAGAPAYTNPNATVDVANAQTYVHLKSTGEWVLVQNQATTGIAGGHFVADFSGNAAIGMQVNTLPGGSAALDTPPSGYNDHFWPSSRGTFAPGTVDAVYVQMDMKVSDPNLHLVANIGADWWRDANADFQSGFNNNPGAGISNWVDLSTQWSTLGFYSTSTAQFQGDLPPPLAGSAETPPPAGLPDTEPPAAPQIASFTPDTGTVGDKITSASVLTLTGTAEAGSTVKMFDGTTQIGTAKTGANGAWSLATAELSTGAHNFTATATDAAGNTGSASSPLNVNVEAASLPPVASPPASGANLLVNGSFEASPLSANHWEGFSSIPGWTALTGGTIELWNDLNGVKATDGGNFGELDFLGARDGFHQTVKTDAGQNYDLSFDAQSRPGFTSATTAIEVLWNDSLVATVPPGSTWETYNFAVTGTGGDDRLTFREASGQSADGLGALYDNVSLVPVGSGSSVQQSAVTETTRAMDLVKQFSATSFANPSFSPIGGLNQTDTSTTLAQTLARSH